MPDTPKLSSTPVAPGAPADLDEDMTKKEKTDMADQMEEFEGPERREIRGDDKEPAKDPGVAHS
jgi:hypothetical protein